MKAGLKKESKRERETSVKGGWEMAPQKEMGLKIADASFITAISTRL